VIVARARLVLVGACSGPVERLHEVRRTIEEGGLVVVACVLVEDDDAALDAALAGDAELVLVVEASPQASAPVRRAVARASAQPLVLHDRLLARLEEQGRAPESLALLPKSARLWDGSADAAWSLAAGERTFVVLPSVEPVDPGHLQRLAALLATLAAGHAPVVGRTLRVAGRPADEVERRVASLPTGPDVTVACVPLDGEVLVRVRARAVTRTAAGAAAAEVEAAVREALGVDCYGQDDDTLEQVVGGLLRGSRMTLSVAESCTGGLLGHRLTGVPGSSAYFERGVLVYSNEAKQELLGVPEAVLREHGAVSAPCAEAMARGAARLGRTDCALAITGIAGPDGGTPTKPVGTVFVGVAVGDEVRTHHFRFTGGRASVKWQSAQAALDLLRRRLLARPAGAGARPR
jgi:nicotinamide-nucleotide amidase